MGVPDEAAIRGLCCYRKNHVTDDKRGLGLCKNVIGSVCGSARATLWLFHEQKKQL